jgi:hypothetical protein
LLDVFLVGPQLIFVIFADDWTIRLHSNFLA